MILFRALLTFLTCCISCTAFCQSRPNVVLILADDIGYGDLGVYGQKMIHTPNLDALAANGVRFTDYYSGSSVCAPSRETLLTGMHTGHTYVRGNFLSDEKADPAMPPEKTTIAEIMLQAGYNTGLFGKWGLGGEQQGPDKQGFQHSYGYLDQIHAHDYYTDYLYEDGNKIEIAENKDSAHGISSHSLIAKHSFKFIKNQSANRPFFLYLPYTLPHGAYNLPPEAPYTSKDWKTQFKVYATMVSMLDRDIGHIISMLKQQGLYDNTIIIFASDNGANTRFANFFASNGNLRGAKFGLNEGGIRVPLIVSWPGNIREGLVTSHVGASCDLLPTICELTKLRAPQNVDGVSLAPVLTGKTQPAHDFLYWELYTYNYNWNKPNQKYPRNYLDSRAVRMGKWKVLQNDIFDKKNAPPELYDVVSDPGETKNLASQYPDIVKKGEAIMQKESTPDPPFFPYTENTLSNTKHYLKLGRKQDIKQFFHYTDDRIPFISAHRGGPLEQFPENCIETFENTLSHTWSIMEIDPHYTKDSQIVLMHDPTLDRTSTGKGKVSDYTLAQLQALKLKDTQGNITGKKIPTLDEVIEWAKGKTIVIIDMKDVPIEVRAQKIIDHHAEANTMVMAYTLEDAIKCYSLNKDIMMELVFVHDRVSADAFEKSGVPWENAVVFVTHAQPKEKDIFDYIHSKGAMCIRGSSRTIDRAFTKGEINKKNLYGGYAQIIKEGADIIEADLGIEAGEGIAPLQKFRGSKAGFFIEE